MKKLDTHPQEHMDQLIQMATKLYREAYDDRNGRSDYLPSLNSVASEMKTTTIRVRKLLITAGYYSTRLTRRIDELVRKGLSMAEICEKTGLKQAAVYGYLPYSHYAYNLPETTPNGLRQRRFKEKNQVVKELIDAIEDGDWRNQLWKTVEAFAGFPFHTTSGLRFQYSIVVGRNGQKNKEILINRKNKSITQATIELAMKKGLAIQAAEGMVSGPKRLGVFGASYLYPMLIRFGVIKGNLSREKENQEDD